MLVLWSILEEGGREGGREGERKRGREGESEGGREGEEVGAGTVTITHSSCNDVVDT